MIDIYGFMVAGALVTMGTLGDRIGRRRLLFLGAAAFGATSLLPDEPLPDEPLLLLVPPPEEPLLPPPLELLPPSVPVPLPLVSARVSTSRQSEYWSMSAGM